MTIFRRDFIGSLLSIPFLGLKKPKNQYECISKICGNLGKVISMDITQNIEHHLYYTQYPIETRIEIEYEKGTECWIAFNIEIPKFAKLDIETFFKEYKIIPDKFVPILEWRGCKFKLSYINKKDLMGE